MAARRRSNREGSIWQRQDGRWTGAAYVLATDGTFRRTYVYGRTREQVHARLVELQGRSARGIPRADLSWKVGEYLDYWLENIAHPATRPTTYAKYETITRLVYVGSAMKPSLTGATAQASSSRTRGAPAHVANVPAATRSHSETPNTRETGQRRTP